MPYYGFLMQLDNLTLSATNENALVRITMTGCGLSIMGIMCTLFLICYLPLQTDGMFIIGNLVVSVLCSQTCYMGIENSYPEEGMCKMAAGVLHYFFLCLQCWMFVYGMYLFMKLRHHGSRGPKWQKRFVYVLTGWLLPLLIVLTSVLINPRGYGMARICWLSHEHGMHWAFVGPVLVISAINAPIFVMFLRASWAHDVRRSMPLALRLRHQFFTAISLIPVLGFTWVIGLAPVGPGTLVLQYIFVILNSGQGFFILVGHMLKSSQVRSAWKLRFAETDPQTVPQRPKHELSQLSADTHSSDVRQAQTQNGVAKGTEQT